MSWKYPKGLTVIQLTRLWVIGSEKEHTPALGKMKISLVAHFDPRGRVRLHMKFVMHEAKYLARLEGVWLKGRPSSSIVTTMWPMI